jgi:hypothetical protein
VIAKAAMVDARDIILRAVKELTHTTRRADESPN